MLKPIAATVSGAISPIEFVAFMSPPYISPSKRLSIAPFPLTSKADRFSAHSFPPASKSDSILSCIDLLFSSISFLSSSVFAIDMAT